MTRRQRRGYEYVSIFLSFCYVRREDERKELEKRRRSYRRSEESTEEVGFDEVDLSDYNTDRHAFVMCPVVRNGYCCANTGRIRDAGIVHHDCNLLFQPSILSLMKAPDTSHPVSSNSVERTYTVQLQELLISFIAGSPISFRLVASPQFRSLLHGIIAVSRAYPSIPADALLPSLSVHAVPNMLIERAANLFHMLLRKFNNTYVSIHIDSAVITHTSYLAVTLRSCESQSPILPIQLLTAPSDRTGYAEKLFKLIDFLRKRNIFVASICCDGALAQVSGIQDVRNIIYKELLPPDKRSPIIPLHIPCFNHRINLALCHAIRSPALSRICEELQSFAADSGTKPYREVLKKSCPSFVATRWFSLWNIASFIRLNRISITRGSLLSPAILLDVLKTEILLTPFTELTLFFETDQVQLSQVYPAVLRALTQFSTIARNSYFSTGEWLHATIECMVQLYNYCLSGTIGYLIAVAFWLSPYGRYLYQSNRMSSCYRTDQTLSESFSVQFV